jgi:hypothetical protein
MASTIFDGTERTSQIGVCGTSQERRCCRTSEEVLQNLKRRNVMGMKTISMVSGTAFLALTATASAGPMSVASSQVVMSPIPIEQVHYYRHHYRHHGWYRHRHHYGWRYRRHYGWNPAAAVAGTALGLATVPFALATGGWPYYGHPYYGYYGPYYYY